MTIIFYCRLPLEDDRLGGAAHSSGSNPKLAPAPPLKEFKACLLDDRLRGAAHSSGSELLNGGGSGATKSSSGLNARTIQIQIFFKHLFIHEKMKISQ